MQPAEDRSDTHGIGRPATTARICRFDGIDYGPVGRVLRDPTRLKETAKCGLAATRSYIAAKASEDVAPAS